MPANPNGDNQPIRGHAAINGILGGLEGILGKVVDLAERAESISKEGSFTSQDGREGRFQVGFNISTAAGANGEREINVQPFGDVQQDRSTGEAAVTEWREPPTDLFEEDDHVLVIIEMPGISDGEATFDVSGDVLTIEATAGEGRAAKRYRKEVLLPRSFDASAATFAANNGVFEVRLAITEAAADENANAEKKNASDEAA
ncbi:MAG: Hsp20/alpha crystallin family protein [Planctomycetota bacterium]